jgi:dTDP-4-dehydrorhamnose 3,5-epimerase
MRFLSTKVPGVLLIEPELHQDERGFFTRIFCEEELRAHGLVDAIAQSSLSYNRRRGTVRGMHYQSVPHSETKLVACVEGCIFDVCIDLRPDSPTLGDWFGVELSAGNRRMVYIPDGLAHGFQTLVDNSTVLYQISSPFRPEAARGIRWDEPRVGVVWPLTDDLTISEKDRSWPAWTPPIEANP